MLPEDAADDSAEMGAAVSETVKTPRNTILLGDALELLHTLPDGCAHCVVTSPPYFGLRDYGVAGQIGLEATPDDWCARLVAVFAEVRRVLRDDGTLWLNCGDAYATHAKGHSGFSTSGLGLTAQAWQDATSDHRRGDDSRSAPHLALKDKDLIGLPWMLAFALRADGWWLRSDIIWAKPNPMPESVTDRPTRSHEYVFLLSKSRHYSYDADAIREPIAPKTFTTYGCASHPRGNDALGTVKADNWARTVAVHRPRTGIPKVPSGWDTGAGGHGAFHRDPQSGRADKQRGHGRRHAGFNDRWDRLTKDDQQANGANKRDVWTVAPHRFSEAHFATFPPDLIKPCILAGSRPGDLVLDPFGGAGTVGLVAKAFGRDYLLFELNPAYVALATRRLASIPESLWHPPAPDAGEAV